MVAVGVEGGIDFFYIKDVVVVDDGFDKRVFSFLRDKNDKADDEGDGSFFDSDPFFGELE